jgi:hypothetical protein
MSAQPRAYLFENVEGSKIDDPAEYITRDGEGVVDDAIGDV